MLVLIPLFKKQEKWRKRLGGGLRQVGMIAAPAYIALTEMVGRLEEDHRHAKQLAAGLQQIEGLQVERPETNIVLMHVDGLAESAESFLQHLKADGILGGSFGPATVRFVTNYGVRSEEIDEVIDRVASRYAF